MTDIFYERSDIGSHDLLLCSDELVLLPVQVPHRLLEEALRFVVLACDAGDRQPGPLPELVVVDLGDRDTEAVLQLRLRRLDVLALALQRPASGK